MTGTATPPSIPKKAEGTAVASLVLAILGWTGLAIFGWIPAVVCGHIARSKIRGDDSLNGDGLALAGLIASYVGLALTALALLLFFGFVLFMSKAAVNGAPL